ncbi:hypothetical protein B4U80_03421 [Leptotrombidium deliense]|uniref:Alpha-1,6-mannosyl-glycoprotein 2-beta-N-acetylglucosaminyltransferase n=1 Tax=Leptotrombidium deliense TaxID=299467 RepID=A0A443S5M9_9ACAR|nr:hypothetical protein B4U80_03421 [Leptotrombidium deliense]
MQIFYPYSSQIYTHSFPGDDPNDCPREVSKADAIKMKCNSAQFPDKYGHYRESKFTQIKHHWFWKINFIFERLNITKNFNGYVVFIEEDYYLLPDSLHFIEKMRKFTNNDSKCVYSLGLREFEIDPLKTDVAVVFDGIPYHSHIISKQFWNTFKKYFEKFCYYDDCNFDVTFVGVCQRYMNPKPYSIFPLIPRVYHFGDHGAHENKDDRFGTYSKVKKDLLTLEKYLFPNQLIKEERPYLTNVDEWGGFSDPRDKAFCMSLAKS